MQPSTRKKKLGGYPATGVVISIPLALVVIGLFGLVLIYSNRFEAIVRENVVFKVYTRNGLSETQRKRVEQARASREFVGDGEYAVVFVSREAAVKEMSDLAKYQDVLGDNPFRDMFEVRIAPAYHDTTRLDSVKREL